MLFLTMGCSVSRNRIMSIMKSITEMVSVC